jgi:hypothetical protein
VPVGSSAVPEAIFPGIPHTIATRHVRKGSKLDVARQALGDELLAPTSVYVGLA